MREYPQSDNQHLDDRLVEFTDQLLSMEGTEGERMEDIQQSLSTDQELRALQETVILMKRAIRDARPSQDMTNRIRANLVAEWLKTGLQKRPETLWERVRKMSPFRQTTWRSTTRSHRTLAFSFAAVIIIVLVTILLISPSIGPKLSATADGQAGFIAIILALGVIAGVVLLWFMRSKR